MNQLLCKSTFLVAAISLIQTATAQYGLQPTSGTVSGVGAVQLERQPERMRLQIGLLAKGSGLKEALNQLKDRIEAARVQVGVLGAIKDSVTIGDPKLASTKTNQQQQMEQMLAQRLKGLGKRKKADLKTSSPVTVSSPLTAEWTLNAKSIEELLILSHELQEKIKAADLAGTKEATKLSPEEQELFEEAQQSFRGYGSSDEQKPGEPTFLFVSPVSQEDRDKALAEAFLKAKAKAARLAKAAGSNLGDLKSVSNQNSPGADSSDYSMYGGYNSFAYRAMQQALASSQNGTGEPTEAIGALPGKLKFTVTVTASFDLKAE